jgi:SAM-dependent methyltransferase
MSTLDAVVWHDLECGRYTADLPIWEELAQRHPGTVLDVGAGTGRVALALARSDHPVIALERDAVLADELARRARGLAVEVRCADACAFRLRSAVSLAIVAMHTIHLFPDRPAFLRCARGALAPGGLLAVALLGEGVEPFELELEPDRVQVGAASYESTPTALRLDRGAVVIERRRALVDEASTRSSMEIVRLHPCDPDTLVAQARDAGFAASTRRISIPPTVDHAGSEIVCLEAAS